MYIYLSNEEGASAYEVYFDDFKVDHMKSPVIQMEDYYAFGLTFNSPSRENSTPNMYQYNGKEKQDELDLGWLDYGARMYSREIGRWSVVDPKAEKLHTFSLYTYGINNPINYIDKGGKIPIPVIYMIYEGIIYAFAGGTAMYVVTNENIKPKSVVLHIPSGLLSARRTKGAPPYFAPHFWKDNKPNPLNYGQPRGYDLEPPPSDPKDNKSMGRMIVAAFTLQILRSIQEWREFMSEVKNYKYSSLTKKLEEKHHVDAKIDAIGVPYEQAEEAYDELYAIRDKLVEEEDQLRMDLEALEALEQYVDDLETSSKHHKTQPATLAITKQ